MGKIDLILTYSKRKSTNQMRTKQNWKQSRTEFETINSAVHKIKCDWLERTLFILRFVLFESEWSIIKWFAVGSWPLMIVSPCLVLVVRSVGSAILYIWSRLLDENNAWAWRRCQLELLLVLNTNESLLVISSCCCGDVLCVLCTHQSQ